MKGVAVAALEGNRFGCGPEGRAAAERHLMCSKDAASCNVMYILADGSVRFAPYGGLSRDFMTPGKCTSRVGRISKQRFVKLTLVVKVRKLSQNTWFGMYLTPGFIETL